MRGRLFFIGMDAGDPGLLDRWMDEGHLPTLAALRARGTAAVCEAAPELGNGTLWQTLATGVGMGRHGLHYIKQLRTGSYEVDLVNEDVACREPSIWERMSAQGRRCIVIDIFRAPLARRLDGVQISDWLASFRTLSPRSNPESEIRRVTAAFGADPFDGMADHWLSKHEDLGELVRLLSQRVEMKTRAVEHYLQTQPWDVFMTAYADPHDVSHLCWHLHDDTSKLHDAQQARALGDPVKRIYSEIDRDLGRLLAHLSPADTVVFFAGLGFQNLYSIADLFDRLLRRLDGEAASGPQRPPGRAQALRQSALRKVLPNRVRHIAGRLLFRATERLSADDRRRRRFFALPCEGHAGAVRINVQGREPDGRVTRAEYEQVLDELEQGFSEIVNVDTGRPLITGVVRTRERYPGPCVDDLPDLFVVWDRSAPIRTVRSARIGEMRVDTEPLRTGDHTPFSLLIAAGPGIEAQRLAHTVTPEDVSATLMALAGCDPSPLDGRPIAAIAEVASMRC